MASSSAPKLSNATQGDFLPYPIWNSSNAMNRGDVLCSRTFQRPAGGTAQPDSSRTPFSQALGKAEGC